MLFVPVETGTKTYLVAWWHQYIEELIEASDNDLFMKVQNRIHCLSSLLPHANAANYRFNLRPRGHHLSHPSVKKVLFKYSFIIRVLYKYK